MGLFAVDCAGLPVIPEAVTAAARLIERVHPSPRVEHYTDAATGRAVTIGKSATGEVVYVDIEEGRFDSEAAIVRKRRSR